MNGTGNVRIARLLAAALGTALATSAGAQVVINGDVSTSPGTGAITVDGDTTANPAAWTYWTFCAVAGDNINVEVDRLVGEMDPVASVVAGNLAGAAFGGTIFDDPLMGLMVVGFGDDNDPPFIGGPFGDPNISFVAPATGIYTVAVSSFLSQPIPVGGYEHRVTVTGATQGTTLTLVAPDDCLNAGETTLTVNVDMSMATDLAVGGQFFLEYDTTRLVYLGGAPGGGEFVTEILDNEPVAGQIDYAVGVDFGGVGTDQDSTMATLTFQVIGDACAENGLVWFRENTPPTRVTNGGGENILCYELDLGAVSIDTVAPVLTLSSGLTATDACGDAPSIFQAGTYQFSTLGASNDPGDLGGMLCGSSGTNADVWYMLVPPLDGTCTVSTCGLADYDTVLAAMDACAGNVIVCNDDSCGLLSTITFPVRKGIPVQLRMSGFSSSVGSGFVSVNFVAPIAPPPAAADQCGSAPSVGEGTYPFDTTSATNDGGPNLCTSGAAPADVWLQYVPTFTGSGTVETCNLSTGDTVLHAYDGCGGALLSCNDDACGLQSRVTFPVSVGVPVWIRVSRFNGGAVSGSVAILPLPPGPPAPPAFTLDRVVKADAGFCDAVVTFGATATDDCDANPSVVCNPPSGSAFPIGTTTVTCTATDACGNFVTSTFDVTVLPFSEMIADVELAGVDPGAMTRCITFDLFDIGACPGFTTHEQSLWFENGVTRSVVDVPCGVYQCVTARDRLHTLRRTDDDGDFGVVGTRYVTNFTAAGSSDDSLIGGNFNDDEFIEILDFGIFAGQFGTDYGSPSTDCSTAAPHADASGDGLVTPADFTFIQTNFLAAREADCCGGLSTEKPRDSIPVGDLYELGHPEAAVADFTRDGVLDVRDVVAFLEGARPCPSDWNRDAFVNTQDFFGFLTAFFAGDADYNRDGTTNSQDFFNFVSDFLSGC